MSLIGTGEVMTVVGLVVLLVGEYRDKGWLRATGKPFASLGFLVVALSLAEFQPRNGEIAFTGGAVETQYGRVVFAGLALGALGDVLLLGRGKSFFIAGLVSFLLGHVAYAVAFSSLGLHAVAAIATALAMTLFMFVIGRWVFPHAPDMRAPIVAYMLVIALMCVAAVSAWGAGAPSIIPLGAIMFTVSDIAVVRDRFVSRGFVNRAWGLPMYYAAQLLIAWSIHAVG